jgi:hypothetical protein
MDLILAGLASLAMAADATSASRALSNIRIGRFVFLRDIAQHRGLLIWALELRRIVYIFRRAKVLF